MTAQEIFKIAGYCTSDNRSINWRNINKAIEFGISIELIKLGYTQTSKGGTKYRFALKYKLENGKLYCRYFLADHLKRYSNNSDIVADYAIEKIVSFRKELVELGHFENTIKIAQEKGMCKCSKCKGTGIIPAFMHYCKGVCFDCMGLGYGKQGLIKIT